MPSSTPVARALAFVEEHGVVLASARGAAPRLIEFIAGESISGNWWSHPRANAIYNVLSQVTESEHVLVCRMINGKITLVHRRLWPALVRLAERFAPQQIAQVQEQHTATGRHKTHEVPFPDWVPPGVARQSSKLPESEAFALLSARLPAGILRQ
jgi:hypothetical protein